MSTNRKPSKTKKRRKRSGALHAALILVLLVLAAAALLGGVLVFAPLLERADSTVVDGSDDWMGRLDDATPLSEIILPGTHASVAVNTPRGFFTKCQAMTVTEQLRSGFRLLDLQLGEAAHSSGFELLYGDYPCNNALFGRVLTLDDILAQCCAFLNDHPSETVLLSLRLADPSLSTRQAQLLLDAYIRESPRYFLLTDRLPTLGEARGHLVILRSWEDEIGLREAAGVFFRWSDQSGNEDFILQPAREELDGCTLFVQDRSDYSADDKWDAFLGSQQNAEAGSISLSFLSTRGDTDYGHPYEFAKDLNTRLCDYEGALHGWILVDFGSAPVAERIWRENF